MKLPQLIPPKDLLERVQGVETGLKRGKSVEKVGWGAFIISAGPVVLWLVKTAQDTGLKDSDFLWPVIGVVAAIVVIVMLINWTRIWVRSSRKSFRYTYSIAPFDPIAGSEHLPRSPDSAWGDGTDMSGELTDGATDESALPPDESMDEASATAEPTPGEAGDAPVVDEAETRDSSDYDSEDGSYTDGSEDLGATGTTPLAWFVQDLTDRLSRRIGRLSWLAEDLSDESTAQSHIHIDGTYGVRENAQGVWNVEVLPRVRIGRKKDPATVAHLVKFAVGPGQTLAPEAYEKLLERLYFSVASHLYAQIRVDVDRKINLLPKRYFRASAYFHEAGDYARSNTLDAYEQARELYAEVIRLYDPAWWHFSGSRIRRSFQRVSAWWLRVTLKVRARAARFWPSFARAQLMVARAEIGYASMVLNRRTLAGMSGQRLNSVFEARPVAASALERLGELADDTPGWADALFEANVTLAASNAQLGATERAAKHLDDAKELDPRRAQTDSRFLHVHGQIVESRRSVVDLHRAVELDSTSDVAQFDLASALEMMWRARTTLERDVAEVVRDEYERVLTVNPGNISAWGNLGYIDWLLGEKEDLEQAEKVFERGREYKEIKRETFVSELDYGLARISAERGDFNEAYRRYIDAAGARFGQGVAHDQGYTDYQFARVTRAVVRRFERFRDEVRKKWKELDDADAKDPSARVRNAVYAFVLNDYAEACLNYFLRSANRRYLEKAKKELVYAERELKANYPMIYFNLHRVLSLDKHADSKRAGDFIERVVELQPDWVDGKLERSLWYLDVAGKGLNRANQLEREAEGLGGDAKRHSAQAVVRREKGKSALFEKREQSAGHLLSLLRSGAIEGSAEHAGSSAEHGIGWQGGDHPETRAAPEPRAAPELELPLPLTTPLEDQVAARQLDQEAETIHRRAETLLERAQTERAVAKERERDTLDVVRELLPHGWLWKKVQDPETGETRDELDLSAFDNPEFLRTRRWERELDEVHVRALVMWCRLPQSADAADREHVLEFVHKHFLPSDYDVLTERSKLVKGGNDAEELREVVKDWVEGEHAWWSLRRVTDGGLFAPADAAEVLIRVARTDRTLPDGLFLWVAGRLDRLAGTLEEKARTAEAPEAAVELQQLAEDCRSEAENCHHRIRQSALADASVLFKLGDVLLARGDDDAALDAYGAAEKIDEEEGYETQPVTAYRQAMAVPLWKLGRYRKALDQLTQIDEAESARGDEARRAKPWRDKVVTDLLECDAVKTAQAYRLLKDWLGRVLTANRSDEHVRQDASTALLRLGLLRYHQLERRTLEPEAAESITNAMSPTVPPVVLEADAGSFFPEDAETPRVQQMLAADGDISRMRKRVEARMGIEVPGMQLLSGPGLGPGRYNVILDGALAAVGTLGSESLFATDLEACRRHGLDGREDVDPLDETQPGGLWLAPDVEPPAELEIIDRYEYMLRHAESVLLRNLDLFYGIEQAAAVFAEAKMVSTPESLVRMAAVSRALLREGVPLRDPKAIAVEVVKPDADAVELPALVERVREALAKTLPGADGSRPLVSVRHDIEDEIARWTQRRDGKEFIAVPGAKLAELRRLVDEQVASLEPGAALVVRPRGLRRFVRRVVELDHPTVTVLAFTELPPDVQLQVEEPLLSTASVEAIA